MGLGWKKVLLQLILASLFPLCTTTIVNSAITFWSKRMTSKSQRVIWIFLRQFLLYSTFCIQKPPNCLQKPIIEGSDAHLWNGEPLPTFQVYITSISSTQNCTSLVFLVPTITWLWSWKWMRVIISFSTGWKKCMLDVPMHDVYTLT